MSSDLNNNLDDLLNNFTSQYKSSNASEKLSNNSQIEDLLNEVKSELKSNKDSSLKNENEPVTQNNTQIENLLNEVKSELNNNKRITSIEDNRVTQNDSQIENLLNEVKSELKSDRKSASVANNRATQNNSQVNEYLDSIKARHKDRQDRQKKQQDSTYNRNKQEIIVTEQQKQLKHKQLVRQAEKWLANLDPSSDEGMWFYQLAESYPSKLDAAISYLSALDKSSY